MQLGIVTLFPELFAALSEHGVSSRAIKDGLVHLDFWNPRQFTTDRHQTIDDKPYGGGPGMLMKTEPLAAAIGAAKSALGHAGGTATGSTEKTVVQTLYLSPQGRPLTQKGVAELASQNSLVLVCGRYQGIDARLLESEIDTELSLGDFILSGGELAAMALIDALIRLQPGALGDENSAREDSFSDGLLHCPEYTRPATVAGLRVPEVLLSGDHQAIARWRLQQSLGVTWLKRPDLLEKRGCNEEERQLLAEFKADYQSRQKDLDTQASTASKQEFRRQE